MSDDAFLLTFILIVVVVGGLLAWKLLQFALSGAAFFLNIAAGQGFVGLAAYLAVWVFLFPFMLAICIFVGLGMRAEEKEERRQLKEQASTAALATKLWKERGYED